MELTKNKTQQTFTALKEQFGYKNVMEAPRLVKVVISTGTGSLKEKEKIELIPKRLATITGQAPAPRAAKKSIATFKLREGDKIGYQVTLRGKRMRDFLDVLLNVALPRTRDFQGLDPKGIDTMGNYTMGIGEHTIFPSVADEELRNVFGFAVTIVTTAKTKDEARAFLEQLGFPFKKEKSA